MIALGRRRLIRMAQKLTCGELQRSSAASHINPVSEGAQRL
jgi:hypothetical protein